MKTLIVDDQYQDKAKVIINVLNRVGAERVELVSSSREALQKMSGEKYDLLVLDLQIPDALGEDAKPQGGKQLLEFIELNSEINRPSIVVAITSHHEAYELCEDFFRARGWTLLLGVEDEELLYSVLTTQKAHLSSAAKEEVFDVAIITALPHTELEAVLKLPCNWQQYQDRDDDNIYYTGTIDVVGGGKKSLIATSAPQMGMAASAALAARVCLKFRPSLLVMTGIAAGIKGKVELGDILVADPCWDWGSGKLTVKDGSVVFLSSPTQIPLDPTLRKKFQILASQRAYMDEIYAEWKSSSRPAHNLNMHVGPMATGAVVLEDPATVELIKQQNRNTIGVEMEAYGVMAAAFYSGPLRPRVVAIKSVCDFADPTKNNEWQAYAAYTSASLAYRFVRDHFFEL
ncbi:phosphorylase family protein [Vogesella indigofera]|uniref:phosphorylase family protein n=1 Tax=Vogesella indigofera TaxID=45465 RepID=UPI003F41D5A0